MDFVHKSHLSGHVFHSVFLSGVRYRFSIFVAHTAWRSAFLLPGVPLFSFSQCAFSFPNFLLLLVFIAYFNRLEWMRKYLDQTAERSKLENEKKRWQQKKRDVYKKNNGIRQRLVRNERDRVANVYIKLALCFLTFVTFLRVWCHFLFLWHTAC